MKRPGGSVIAAFEPIIDQWLTEDQNRWHKQRHTARRVFDRLVAEHGYEGSYSPVQRAVKQWRAQHRPVSEGFSELEWPPGTIQVDFGQAEAFIAGIRTVLHVLIVTFPFSNMRYQRLLESGILSTAQQQELETTYRRINPAQLTRQILTYQDRLISLAKDKTLTIAANLDSKYHARHKRRTTGIRTKAS